MQPDQDNEADMSVKLLTMMHALLAYTRPWNVLVDGREECCQGSSLRICLLLVQVVSDTIVIVSELFDTSLPELSGRKCLQDCS